jgi:hypothetical protein
MSMTDDRGIIQQRSALGVSEHPTMTRGRDVIVDRHLDDMCDVP